MIWKKTDQIEVNKNSVNFGNWLTSSVLTIDMAVAQYSLTNMNNTHPEMLVTSDRKIFVYLTQQFCPCLFAWSLNLIFYSKSKQLRKFLRDLVNPNGVSPELNVSVIE